MGGPIIEDKLGFRISAWGRRDGGWIDRVNYQTLATSPTPTPTASTPMSCAPRSTWEPIDNLTITPGIDYQNRDQHNYDDYWVGISDPAAGQFLNGTPDRHGRSATISTCRP